MERGDHQPVLLNEVVEGLAIKPNGIYVDGTFGRGGHSRVILQRLGPDGRLIALDKDPSAIAIGKVGPFRDPRFCIVHKSFAELEAVMQDRGCRGKVDGILLDLGVSSPQLDDPERGFSFLKDGPLDMRMNSEQGMDAATWINQAAENEISRVLFEYGEERYSRRIARTIVAERAIQPITRTKQLADIIAKSSPTRELKKHPATRSFQAIRIFINRELEDLREGLQQCLDSLAVGGRLCVISFHSLEDRIVKRFIQREVRGDDYPHDLPIPDKQIRRRLRKVGSLIRPSETEIIYNSRARSARLRIAEKLA